jgi:hypothetical protein
MGTYPFLNLAAWSYQETHTSAKEKRKALCQKDHFSSRNHSKLAVNKGRHFPTVVNYNPIFNE